MTPKRSILDTPIDFDRSSFFDLLSLSVGRCIITQDAMGELVIGDNGWNVDVRSGVIRFGDNTFRSGVLGSESESSGTWLWSWANTESGLPEIVSAPSRRAKKLLPDCPEFINGKFSLDELHTGHNISMVCCGVSEKQLCYYRCNYNGGAAFVTVEGLPEEIFAPVNAEQLLRRYMEIISVFYCDHRLLAAGMLYQNGNDIEVTENTITASFGNRKAKFLFEDAGGISRLSDINF